MLSLDLTGIVLQLLLNYRSRTFAGWYKSAVVLQLMLQAMFCANFVPAVVGRTDLRGGFLAGQVAYLVLFMVMGWQVLTLPSVPQTGCDKDED